MANKKLHHDQGDPIDKLFRDGLEKRDFAYDEKYWEEAEKTLANFNSQVGRKRYKGWGWWFGGATALLIIIATWFTMNEKQTGDTLADNTVPANGFSALPSEPNPVMSAQEPVAEPTNTQLKSEETPLHTSNKKITTTNDRKPDLSGYKKLIPIENSSNNAPVSDEPIAEVNGQDQIDPETGIIVSENSDTDLQQISQNADAADPQQASDDPEIAEMRNQEVEIPFVPSFITPTLPPTSRPIIEPIDNNLAKFHWLGGVYAGAQHSYPTITGSNAQWNAFRGSNAKQAFSPTIGGEIGIEFTDHPFTVTTGFQYMLLGEDVIYQINLTETDTTFTFIYDDTTGDITDTIMVINETDSVLMQSALNRLTYTEIPLMFGYTYHLDNWHFSFATGPSIGILQKRIGYYPNSALTAFEDVAELDYFKPLTWFWKAEPTIGYSLDEHVSLQLRASFRWQLSDTYEADDRSLKYWSRGLKLGLQYAFH